MPVAAIVRKTDAPMEIREISVRALRAHEVRVRVRACGVCHSDLSVLNEFFACPLPVVLGHEAAGVVEETGPGVENLRPGDHVVACWSPACGECRYCKSGKVHLCGLADDPTSAAMDRIRCGDEAVAQFLGVGGFADEIILSENAAVKIDPSMPLDKASLLGCAVLTGYGAVTEAAKVQAGQEVAIFGCGGVGLNIVQSAAMAGAKTVIAIDTDPAKLELARNFGATHTLAANTDGIHKEIRKLTEERQGVDFAFDAVGNVEIARTGYQSICKGGEVILVGIAHFKDKLSLSQIVTVTQEKCVRGTTQGSADPWTAIPELVALYGDGKLRIDELVSKNYRLEDANQAMQDLRDGKNARGVIVFD
jgi:S-(hydroxymethyl)glutathione dehydrogenase/alcohol dehydrogenase